MLITIFADILNFFGKSEAEFIKLAFLQVTVPEHDSVYLCKCNLTVF